jgi:ATP-binding cassette subfamily B protein/subfamily B ATP-binding cassette protein MsbA
MKNLWRALRYFRPDGARIGFALWLMLLSTGASLLKPWPLALIVDSVIGSKPLPNALNWAAGWSRPELLGVLALALVALYAGQSALSAWQNFVAIQIGLNGLVRVRNEMFQWLQRMSLRFQQARSQGDLIYRLSWDTYAFQTLFQHGVFTFLGATISLALMLGVMWRLNRPLAGLALLMIPLLILSMKFLGRGMSRRSLVAHQADSQVTSSIQQTITSLPLIQSYTREAQEQERFSERVQAAFAGRLAQHRWEVSYSMVIAAGFGLTTAGLAWLGAREVLAGRLTVGELLVFFGYLTQLYEPLNQLSHVGATVSDASAGTQRVLELLDAAPEITDAPNARPVIRADVVTGTKQCDGAPDSSGPQSRGIADPLLARGNVSLIEVSFAYDPGHPVLQHISLSLGAGESVALIGPSGAGKTTLLQLLPRFYDPSEGRVLLDGVDLRQLRIKDLRAQVALVSQEPLLLLGTIAENIRYGKPEASRSEVKAAAEAANAAEFIERLPQGYDTVVGEGAARLSVGEKQRISIARAFLKDAPILILDEPTSALDVESERLVVDSLARLMKNRTALVVAHRLSTIRNVDRIVVLEAGRVVESGTPDELRRGTGYFARMTGEA